MTNQSTWDARDHEAYQYETHVMSRGQVTPESALGRFIRTLGSHPNLFRFLEIGTWNGLGSTRCFYDAFESRSDDAFSLDSLESNAEKLSFAQKVYAHRSKHMRFHHRVITHDLPPFETIANDLNIVDADKESIGKWHHIDVENALQTPLFLPPFVRNDPFPSFDQVYDVILLDGGECSTYYEFRIVKEWTKILLLDDTNTYKCRRVMEELQRDPEWVECHHPSLTLSDDRNGHACFRRRNFPFVWS